MYFATIKNFNYTECTETVLSISDDKDFILAFAESTSRISHGEGSEVVQVFELIYRTLGQHKTSNEEQSILIWSS